MSLSQVLPGVFPAGEGKPPSRRRGAARELRKRKKRRRRRSFMVILLSVLLVGGGAAGAYLGLMPLVKQLRAPKDYVGAGTGSVQIKIPEGASGTTIARVLTTAGVVKTESAFLNAAADDSRSTKVQPGTYAMRLKMSSVSALALLLDPKSRLVLSVTIPEGTRAKDVLNLIVKKLDLSKADVNKAAKSPDLGLPKAANGKLEGYLFPARYDFQPDVTASQVLEKMVSHGKDVYAALGIPSSQLKADVIKASIVQAEVGKVKYMGKVAQVLDNRLAISMPLGLDSTVSYATQKFNVTTTAADRRSNSPYNTYVHTGLPAGPISNPGEAALKAVLHPTAGKWLYFVTVNPTTGETKFAVTKAEHDANAAQFQQWLRDHPQSK
jgi:UPF0755 protein